MRWWPLNGKTAFFAKRVVLYGAAGTVLVTGFTWVNGKMIERVAAAVLARIAAYENRLGKVEVGQIEANRKLTTVVVGQELLMDVALEGVYTQKQIDGFLLRADLERAAERRELQRIADRLDSLVKAQGRHR